MGYRGPSTVYREASTVYRLPSPVYRERRTVYRQRYAVGAGLSDASGEPSTARKRPPPAALPAKLMLAECHTPSTGSEDA